MNVPPTAFVTSDTRMNRGRDYLEHRSWLMKKIREINPVKSVLVIDDKPSDADHIAAALHRIYGQEVTIAVARTERDIVTQFKKVDPGLVFLDDVLARGITAEKTVPLLRRAGYTGPIVIVAAIVTRERALELARLAVGDVVHKDDLTSARLAEAILRVFGHMSGEGSPL